MDNGESIEKLSKKYSVSSTEFIKFGATLAMKEKKRELQIERIESDSYLSGLASSSAKLVSAPSALPQSE